MNKTSILQIFRSLCFWKTVNTVYFFSENKSASFQIIEAKRLRLVEAIPVSISTTNQIFYLANNIVTQLHQLMESQGEEWCRSECYSIVYMWHWWYSLLCVHRSLAVILHNRPSPGKNKLRYTVCIILLIKSNSFPFNYGPTGQALASSSKSFMIFFFNRKH